MSTVQHPSARELHAAHAEERVRVQALERQERHAAHRALARALRAMVQPHEPHHFQRPNVAPISPRRAMDFLVAPGGTDNTGFVPGGVC